MSQERAYRRPDYRELGLVPAHRVYQSVHLESEECSERKKDVRPLRPLRPDLRLLYAAALLDTSMVDLDSPTHRLEHVPLLPVHLQVVRCTVLELSVFFSDRPEYPDGAVV